MKLFTARYAFLALAAVLTVGGCTVSEDVPAATIGEVESAFIGDDPTCTSRCDVRYSGCLERASSGMDFCLCNNLNAVCLMGCGEIPPQPLEPCPFE